MIREAFENLPVFALELFPPSIVSLLEFFLQQLKNLQQFINFLPRYLAISKALINRENGGGSHGRLEYSSIRK